MTEPVPHPKSRRGLLLWVAAGLALMLAVGSGTLVGLKRSSADRSSPSATDLPRDFGTVPPFSLLERSGRTVTQSDLDGAVWVASFVFTRCHATCPMVTGIMARLREELPEEVKLVSITVDPRHDRPKVLSEYANGYRAPEDKLPGTDADRPSLPTWWFLTGERDEVYDLIQSGFRLSVQENPDPKKLAGERISHSTRLVLVDRTGNIRGYFESSDPLQIDALRRRVDDLLEE